MEDIKLLNRKFMLIAIFLVGLLAISAVSAVDLNETDEIANDVAVDEKSYLFGVLKYLGICGEAEILRNKARGQLEDLGIRLKGVGDHPYHREARPDGADYKKNDDQYLNR